MRFPRLAHRSAAAHKLHSTPQQDRMNLISGKVKPAAGYRPLAYSSPEAVQTTGTVALIDPMIIRSRDILDLLAPIYGWFTEGFDTHDLKEAKALLDELV